MQPDEQAKYKQLVGEYHIIENSPALADILTMLDDSYETAISAAKQEIDNPSKAHALLQRSVSYDTIRLYIKGKLAEYNK